MTTTTWTLPTSILRGTQKAFLQGAHEVFVLWVAPLKADVGAPIELRRCVVPAQEPGRTAYGVYVRIEGAELQRIQLDNYRQGERSVVQLHTHPGHDVTMSDLDREWEVVRHVGALSIIVPHYGTTDWFGFKGVNVYEREPEGWRLWSHEECLKRITVA
jgi:proteasome lid subunit RPN8/RPN11